MRSQIACEFHPLMMQQNKKQLNLSFPCYPADRDGEILAAGLQ
jgi:hypothetical protein